MEKISVPLNGAPLMIGIVVARFNEYAGKGLLENCVDELRALGVEERSILVMEVPGALEIPMAMQMLANNYPVNAMIGLGAVIRGETYHFEVVSNESARGLMDVQLTYNIPVVNGILTTEDDEQTKARLEVKGRDCARCAVEMGLYDLMLGMYDEDRLEDEDNEERKN